jgi:outer membrane protein OmpA-like peptidoglycan-associated protein
MLTAAAASAARPVTVRAAVLRSLSSRSCAESVRVHHVRRPFWFAAAGLLAAASAHADTPTRNIELTVFNPTPSTSGSTFQVQNADVGKNGDLVIGTWLSYANNPLVLGTVQNDDPVVRHHTMISLGGAYAFGDRFEAGALMPLYVQSGEPVVPPTPGEAPVFGVTPASGTVLGDLTLHGKVRFVRNPKWLMGGGLMVKVPTGGDGEFAGTSLPSARPMLLFSIAASPQLMIHINAGAVLRKKVEFANIEQGSGATWGAGLSYRMARALFVNVEAFGDIVPGGHVDEMGNTSTLATIEGLGGLRYQATQQVSLGVAGGRGLTNGIGAPDFRVIATLAYAPSASPLPPLHKPVIEAPPDPNKEDTDFDKLVDAVDKCPNEREDKDGFEDEDGCPDPDNDKDGVLDEKDKCINVAEDKDGFEDDDGCPELDNDKDGIADKDDKCPNEAEKINGIDDDDGCPDKGESVVISTPDRLELLESVVFNGTAVAKTSNNVLDQLATTLRARTDIIRLRIGVHVQPSKHPEKDQALSDKRANAVRDYLVSRGIEHERIDPKGFGGTKPLVAPGTKGAAAINDRIELIILERQ